MSENEQQNKTEKSVKKICKKLSGVGYWVASILIIYIAFFVINYFTPALADDFYYIRHLSFGSGEKIESLSGLIQSTTAFYKSWGGRIFGYSLMVILNVIPPAVFDLLNSAVEMHKQYIQREEYILGQKAAGNMDVAVPIISYKYPFRSKHDALSGLSDITEDSSHWINQSLAGYYGTIPVTELIP